MNSIEAQTQKPIETTIQQPVAAPIQQNSSFDNFLIGTVNFVDRFIKAFKASSTINTSSTAEGEKKQDIPGAVFLGKIGTTVDTIQETAKKVIETGADVVQKGATMVQKGATMVQNGADKVVETTEEYISDKPSEPVVQPKDFISKNYHANNQENK